MTRGRSQKLDQVWCLLFGFILLAAIINIMSLIVGWWFLIALPIAIAAVFSILKAKRILSLRDKGYFAGRRFRGQWLYEEIHDGEVCMLPLKLENTEPGHFELYVPSLVDWSETVPLWAANRREEIVRRIAERFKESDIHYPPDWQI